VLMLRGPQTVGELKARTERLYRFDSLADVEASLEGLAERELALRQPRRPGQKEERYAHLLGEDEPGPVTAAFAGAGVEADDVDLGVLGELERELQQLRAEVSELRASLSELEDRLGG